MTPGRRLLGSLLAVLAGCAAPRMPEHLPRRVAVLPVNNRTGDPLEVSGAGVLDRYVFQAPVVTVADVLEAEAALRLHEQGFDVLPAAQVEQALKRSVPASPAAAAEMAERSGLGAVGLYLELRRWEADERTHVRSVRVDLRASLVDPSTRAVLWKSARGVVPVPTPGQVLLEPAYLAAAHTVVAELLAGLHPEGEAPR